MTATVIAGVHPVHEALKSGRAVDRVSIAKGAGGARLQDIIELCRARKVPIRFENRDQLDRDSKNATHQGVIAYAAAHAYAALNEVPEAAKLVVVLDGIEDPHNLGAIIRTADGAGADAVIIPERRAAGLTETVAKAAAGALEYVRVVRAVNLSKAIEDLKERGFWVYGLDERGAESYDKVEYHTPTAFVMGAEGRGLHAKIRKYCDVLVRIPLAGKIPSLNVSVATGIVLFDWKRRNG